MKAKSCKQCKSKFIPDRPLQMVCSFMCSVEYTKANQAKKAKKDWIKEKAERKEKIMKKGDWEKLLQDQVNHIARLLDNGCNCISCNPNTPIQKAFGGHLHAVGGNAPLRYNLHIIHRQCFSCNGKKGGVPLLYLEGIVREYGQEYADYIHYDIKRKYTYLGLTIETIKEKIMIAKLIKKELIELGNNYTPEERVRFRHDLNNRIGIYL
jgi:hypothetical protein